MHSTSCLASPSVRNMSTPGPRAVGQRTEYRCQQLGVFDRRMLLVEIGQSVTGNDWAALGSAETVPAPIQSGAIQRGGKTGRGNRYLKGALGEAAAAAAKTDTFLGERYRRIVKRRDPAAPGGIAVSGHSG
jgi:transposase